MYKNDRLFGSFDTSDVCNLHLFYDAPDVVYGGLFKCMSDDKGKSVLEVCFKSSWKGKLMYHISKYVLFSNENTNEHTV